jgi:uncharacterized membrane protein YdbT with pleckstrin-like domain
MSKELIYKPSRMSFAVNYFLSIILILLLISLYKTLDLNQTKSAIIFLFTLIFLIALLAEPEIFKTGNSYIITSNEIIHTSGILSKKQIILKYNKIESIKINQSILGRIFDYGDIYINSNKNEIIMRGLKNVNKVYSIINEKFDLNKQSHPMVF